MQGVRIFEGLTRSRCGVCNLLQPATGRSIFVDLASGHEAAGRVAKERRAWCAAEHC